MEKTLQKNKLCPHAYFTGVSWPLGRLKTNKPPKVQSREGKGTGRDRAGARALYSKHKRDINVVNIMCNIYLPYSRFHQPRPPRRPKPTSKLCSQVAL